MDDNIICLSATQLMHACMVRATVQQLLRKTLNFISAELGLHGPSRPELNSIDYKI